MAEVIGDNKIATLIRHNARHSIRSGTKPIGEGAGDIR
jgi:hypothetical protein